MSAKANHLKIGVFVLVGLGILLAGLFAFGARSYFQEKAQFETYVAGDVEGLSVGSVVKLRGVPVGKVTKIGFTWSEYPEARTGRFIVVQFEINTQVAPPGKKDHQEIIENEVNRGLRVRVKGQGITGTSILSLEYVNPAENPLATID